MSVYTIQLPDGRKAKVQAPDEKAALDAANRIPALSGEKADYQRELVKQRGFNATRRKADEGGLTHGVMPAFNGQAPLPILDEIAGGVGAIGNEATNLYRRATGKPTVSSRGVYEGIRDASNEYDAETRRLHPVASLTGGLLTGLATGPGKAAALKGGALLAPLTKGQAVKQAVKVGAGTGAAYGALEGRTLGERLENAEKGLVVGAGTGGLLEGVATPLVKAGASKAVALARDVAGAFKKPDAVKEAARGTRSAVEILQRKGLSADLIEAEADELRKRGTMAAERAGKDVETQLGMTARRGGATGDEVSNRVRERAEAAPDRMLADLEDSLGIDAARAQAGIEEQGELGRALAKDDYAAIDANPAGIMTDELQEIMQRPDVAAAIERVKRSGKNAGREGEGLALGTVDVPSKPVGPDDLGLPSTEMAVPRGPAEPPGRGPSALTFLRMTGHGITDELGGEAAQAGLRLGARKGGAEMNDMAIRLHEAGYTPRVLDETEMAELLESGSATKLFSREPDAGAQSRYEARQAAEDFNARGGDPNDPEIPHPDQYGDVGPAPERPLTEPAKMTAPTGESWVRIKRTLDKLVKRDPVTKRVIRTGEEGLFNDDMATLSRDLNEAMKTSIPNYREAVGKAAEPFALEDAFSRGADFLTKGSEGQFAKSWKSLKSDGEREAFKSGVASNLYEMWSQGQLKAGRIKTPRMMGKLELAFGRKQARDMVARLEQEAKLAASGSRIAPNGGSATYGLGAAEADAGEAIQTGALGRITGKLFTGHPLQAAGDALSTVAGAGRKYAATAGMSEAARDAYGKVLMMGPDELIPLLREFESMPPPAQAAIRERALALGLIGGQTAGVGVAGDRPDR